MEIAKMNDLFAEAMENLGSDGYVIPDGLKPRSRSEPSKESLWLVFPKI